MNSEWFLRVTLLLATGASLFAAPPAVESLFPAGGKRGTEVEVTLSGTLDPWPLKIAKGSASGLTWQATEKKGVVRVTIPPEATLGGHLVRFYNEEGATGYRQFVVGENEELEQKGGELMTVDPAQFPVTINGRLEEGGQVDRFVVSLAKGQKMVASVTAHAIDSPLDALLHVRGPRGEQLAFNHDATQIGLDPELTFIAPAAGDYQVHLSGFAHPPRADIRFAGGATSIYRFTLANSEPVLLLTGAEEQEGMVQQFEIPGQVNGKIHTKEDVDRFRFEAKKGEWLQISVSAATVGSWMDAVFTLYDSKGKTIKRVDDASKTDHDPTLDWLVPSDGQYDIEVANLNERVGEEAVYILDVQVVPPWFELTADKGVCVIKPGEKLEVTINTTRRGGLSEPVSVTIKGLPEGVTVKEVDVPEKGGAVKVTLEAAESALPFSGPISLRAIRKSQPDFIWQGKFLVKGATTEAGALLVNRADAGWLTVLKKEEEKKEGP